MQHVAFLIYRICLILKQFYNFFVQKILMKFFY